MLKRLSKKALTLPLNNAKIKVKAINLWQTKGEFLWLTTNKTCVKY